jgi:hypothetical protein
MIIVIIIIDYVAYFIFFFIVNTTPMYDKVELKEEFLKCFSLGVTTRSNLTLTEGNHEQDRQCTYNVTLKRVRATIVAVEEQILLHILSVCLYP